MRSYIVYVKRVRALRICFCLRLIVKVKQKNEQRMNKEEITENIINYKSETHEVAVDKYECGYARFSASPVSPVRDAARDALRRSPKD